MAGLWGGSLLASSVSASLVLGVVQLSKVIEALALFAAKNPAPVAWLFVLPIRISITVIGELFDFIKLVVNIVGEAVATKRVEACSRARIVPVKNVVFDALKVVGEEQIAIAVGCQSKWISGSGRKNTEFVVGDRSERRAAERIGPVHQVCILR